MRVLSVLLASVLFPSLALAHAGSGDPFTLAHGIAHPLGGLDHVLAMVAVGVLAVVLGGRALIFLPLAFVTMMVLGFLLGLAEFQLPFVELGIALSSVVIGGIAAFGRPVWFPAILVVTGLFATLHGHAHGAEMPDATSATLYALGFVLATALLHLSGIFIAFAAARVLHSHQVSSRLVGGTIALGGLGVMLGWA